MSDDCDCCNSDDPCISTNCTFFEDNFNATIGSRISSYPNSSTPPGTITSSAIQSTDRGNDPPCWRVDTEINSTAGQYGDLFAINMTTWSWNPSSQGAITALRFCIDEYIDSESFYTRSDSTSKDPSVECWFIVKQGGKTYGCKISSLNTKAVWRKQYLDGIVQDDFEEIYSGQRPAGAGVTNTGSHPDFTFLGGAITFGWAVKPDGPDTRADIQTEAYTFWDNLCINVSHDARTVDPGSQCQPTGCTLFASSLSDLTVELKQFAGNVGNLSVSTSADSVVGINPPSLRIDSTSPGPSAGGAWPYANVIVFHKDKVSPSTACGIDQVYICVDVRSERDAFVGKWYPSSRILYPFFKQDGKYFGTNGGGIVLGTSPVASFGSKQFTVAASSLVEYAFNANGSYSVIASSHPDFSSNGADIEVGVRVDITGFSETCRTWIDNLCVKVADVSWRCNGCAGSAVPQCLNEIYLVASGDMFSEAGSDACQWVRALANSVLFGGVVLSPVSSKTWRFSHHEQVSPVDFADITATLQCDVGNFGGGGAPEQPVLTIDVTRSGVGCRSYYLFGGQMPCQAETKQSSYTQSATIGSDTCICPRKNTSPSLFSIAVV